MTVGWRTLLLLCIVYLVESIPHSTSETKLIQNRFIYHLGKASEKYQCLMKNENCKECTNVEGCIWIHKGFVYFSWERNNTVFWESRSRSFCWQGTAFGGSGLSKDLIVPEMHPGELVEIHVKAPDYTITCDGIGFSPMGITLTFTLPALLACFCICLGFIWLLLLRGICFKSYFKRKKKEVKESIQQIETNQQGNTLLAITG